MLSESGLLKLKTKIKKDVLDYASTSRLSPETVAFQNLILESSLDCIMVFDFTAKLSFINGGGIKALEICGLNGGEETYWLNFWEAKDKVEAAKAFEDAKFGEASKFVGYCETFQTNTPKWWHVVVNPLRNAEGKIYQIMAVLRDISHCKDFQIQIEEKEQQFKTLVNAMPQLTWMATAEGEVYWYNEGWFTYTGTTLAQMKGWGWQHVHDPKILPRVLEKWRNCLAVGEPFEMEFPLKGADGKFRIFLTRVNPIRCKKGTIIQWFGTNTNIDEIKRTKEALDESVELLQTLEQLGRVITAELNFEKLVQAITDAATKVSKAQFGALFYNVTHKNEEAYMLYTLSGAPHEAFSKFPMPRNTAIFDPTFKGEEVIRSDNITLDPRYGKSSPFYGMPKGHLAVKSYMAIPIRLRTGEVWGGLFFGHPAEGIFGEKEEVLVKGLAIQAAIAIENARLFQKAQEAIHTRDTFLSIASHELKTPLTSLKLQVQFRKRSINKGDFSHFLPELLPTIIDNDERQINRLVRLVDNMLDISQLNAGKISLQVEMVDLCSLVKEVVGQLSAQFLRGEGEVFIGINCSPTVCLCDRYRIEQVILNLLTNAMKYGEGKPVQIQVISEGASAHIIVTDQGRGITPEDQSRIFGQFERAISASEVSGLGLGLYISKQIVEAHGGKIFLNSIPNSGSTFTVTLPLPHIDKL